MKDGNGARGLSCGGHGYVAAERQGTGLGALVHIVGGKQHPLRG